MGSFFAKSLLAGAKKLAMGFVLIIFFSSILLLSDRLKQHIVETTLDSHLNSKAKPQSFEIGRGKKLRSDRYQFPIALFPAPSNVRTMRPQMATLLVIKTGKNEWAIDKLP